MGEILNQWSSTFYLQLLTKLKYSFSRHTDEIKPRLSCVNLEFEY